MTALSVCQLGVANLILWSDKSVLRNIVPYDNIGMANTFVF